MRGTEVQRTFDRVAHAQAALEERPTGVYTDPAASADGDELWYSLQGALQGIAQLCIDIACL